MQSACLGLLVAILVAPSASAAPACVRAGERTLASSPRLVLVAPAGRAARAGGVRLVCRRDSGTRRTLTRLDASCTHCASSLRRTALRGRFAYAVLSHRAFNDQQAELVTLDTDTWRRRRQSLDLADQNDDLRTDVTTLLALPRGRAVLRLRNDFAAAIVLAGPDAVTTLDEGLATAIGRPRLLGTRLHWSHGADVRSEPANPASHCPLAPAPAPTAGLRPGDGGVLATLGAVTSGSWYCLRSTGAVGRVDGVVVRLLGTLAVVQRRSDLRVVDLRTATTITGPAASDAQARSSAEVGASGTLVLRRPGACGGGETEIVALAAGMPERRLACGDLRDVRYVDGIVRWRDQRSGEVRTVSLP